MTYLLSIDPGEMTGIVLGSHGPRTAYHRVDYWQVPGGLDGFLQWHQGAYTPASDGDWAAEWNFSGKPVDPYKLTVVSERFVLRNNPFVANTEPLRIEGAMVALGMNPVWQLRTAKALVPDQVLKANGLWLTGKSVGQKDARDVNDATIHALAWLKKQKHMPTLKEYWGEE